VRRVGTLLMILGVAIGLGAATWFSFGRAAAVEVQRIVERWIDDQTTPATPEDGGMPAEQSAPVFSEAFRK